MPVQDAQNDSQTMTRDELQDAIQKAYILLSYASNNGIPLKESDINYIIKLWNNRTISEDDESSFWMQYSQLAAAIAPATAESILAMHTQIPGQKSKLQNTVCHYRRFTLAMLVLIIFFQAYFTFGNFILNDIKLKKEQEQQIEEKLYKLRYGNEERTTGKNKEYTAGIIENYAEREIRKIKQERDQLEVYIETDYACLKTWSAFYGFTCKNSTETNNDPDEMRKEKAKLIPGAVFVLDILQTYLLPLIYGLLGTCVYILRDLSFKAKNCSYTEAANINFTIRLLLGALSGITSAWFIDAGKSSESIRSLSPFALAFLTGYSIEIVFSAMDRFIGAVTGKNMTDSPRNGKA